MLADGRWGGGGVGAKTNEDEGTWDSIYAVYYYTAMNKDSIASSKIVKIV
jgi:hypothetical protein